MPEAVKRTNIGQYGYDRGLLAMSHTFGENDFYGYNGQDRVVPSVNPGTILGAIEAFHDDGPWDPPENFRKLNFVLAISMADAERGLCLVQRSIHPAQRSGTICPRSCRTGVRCWN